MSILFDFVTSEGTQPVTVHTDDDATFESLRRCQDGEVDGDQIIRLVCEPANADHQEWMFRARCIKNVRRA